MKWWPLRPKCDVERLALSVEILDELGFDRADVSAGGWISARRFGFLAAASEEELRYAIRAGAREQWSDRRVEDRRQELAGQLTIQSMPYLSVNMPNHAPQNALSSGTSTFPPFESALKTRFASASLSVVTQSDIGPSP